MHDKTLYSRQTCRKMKCTCLLSQVKGLFSFQKQQQISDCRNHRLKFDCQLTPAIPLLFEEFVGVGGHKSSNHLQELQFSLIHRTLPCVINYLQISSGVDVATLQTAVICFANIFRYNWPSTVMAESYWNFDVFAASISTTRAAEQ